MCGRSGGGVGQGCVPSGVTDVAGDASMAVSTPTTLGGSARRYSSTFGWYDCAAESGSRTIGSAPPGNGSVLPQLRSISRVFCPSGASRSSSSSEAFLEARLTLFARGSPSWNARRLSRAFFCSLTILSYSARH